MNSEDIGSKFWIEVQKAKLKLISQLDNDEFKDGIAVMVVPQERHAIATKACEELREEFSRRNISVQILIADQAEDDGGMPAGHALGTAVVALSLACDQLAAWNKVPALMLRKAFMNAAFNIMRSMSEEELEKFLKEKYPIDPP